MFLIMYLATYSLSTSPIIIGASLLNARSQLILKTSHFIQPVGANEINKRGRPTFVLISVGETKVTG